MKTKTKKTELDVDFIGGQGSLTAPEQKALSAFLKQRKLASKKTIGAKKLRTTKPANMSA